MSLKIVSRQAGDIETDLPVVGPGRDGLDLDGLAERRDELLLVVVHPREDLLQRLGRSGTRHVGCFRENFEMLRRRNLEME